MTKKSLGRQQRDAQKKHEEALQKAGDELMEAIPDNTYWDDLQKIYAIQEQGLHLYCLTAAGLKDRAIACGFMKQTEVFAANVHRLTNNLKAIIGELRALKLLHIDRTGSAKTPEELINTIEIMEQYNLFTERMVSLVGSDLEYIEEQLANAEKRRAGVLAEIGVDDAGNPVDKKEETTDNQNG